MSWMTIVGYLPPPPGTSTTETGSGGHQMWQIVLLAAAILGFVVLIAWLLKPIVSKRLRPEPVRAGSEDVAGDRSPDPLWTKQWTAPPETERRPNAATDQGSVSFVAIGEPKAESNVFEDSSTPRPVAAPGNASSVNDDSESQVSSELSEIVAITSIARALLERANAGRVREGFELYSDAARKRFRSEMGLTPEEFDRAFDDVPALSPENRAELAAVTDVEWLEDGRVRALISYGNGGTFPPPERFTFVREHGTEWRIDDIESV